MRLSVIFATRANEFALPHVKRILQCLYQQTFQDFQVIIVCDKKFEDEQDFNAFYQEIVGDNKRFEKVQFFTHLNSDFVPSNNNGSYVRNFGIKAVDTELIQLFDEDNAFDSQYLERAVTLYDSFKQQEQTEVVICSTMLYRDTNQIQNQGFSYFSYWQSRPKVNFLGDKPYAEIQMFSGNGVLGNAQLFQSVLYDEEIAWIAEDLDFTLSLYEKGAKLFSFAELQVRHYEREKSFLEHAWIGFPRQARQKSRNWFLFVYKHGRFWDKVAFWCVGLPGCLVWLSLKAILYGGKERWKIIGGLFAGCREGWKKSKEKDARKKLLDSREKEKV